MISKSLVQALLKMSLVAFLMVISVSCYRMPTDEDCCMSPTINNPSITREKGGNLMPSIKY